MKFNLSTFLNGSYFWCHLRIFCLKHGHKIFFCLLLCFTFTSVVHFELISVKCEIWVKDTLYMNVQFSITICWKDHPFIKNYFTFIKNQLIIYVGSVSELTILFYLSMCAYFWQYYNTSITVLYIKYQVWIQLFYSFPLKL